MHAQVTPDGTLTIQASHGCRSVFATELRAARTALPIGNAVVGVLRRAARYRLRCTDCAALTMVYVETGVPVALVVPEPHSPAGTRWHAHTRASLVSAVRCVTEFASALGIKQRTGQHCALQAQATWQRSLRFATHDLLLPVATQSFHRAAALSIDAASGLRAGYALHLGTAELAGLKSIATLDAALDRHAQRLKIRRVALT